MYQSKYVIKAGTKDAFTAISDGHTLHRAVQQLFASGRKEHDVQYARHYTKDAIEIYIRSDEMPKPSTDVLEAVYSKNIPEMYPEGSSFRFYLTCNPTVRRDGKRWFINEKEKRLEWLLRKAEMCGFGIKHVIEADRGDVAVKRKGGQFKFPYVTFTGILTVKDPDLFASCLKKGIGHEKAYGMGMLLITP